MNRVQRARGINKIMTGVFYLIAVFFFTLLIGFASYVIIKGFTGATPEMFAFARKGSIGNQLFNTIYLVFISLLFSIPLGVTAGIYLAMYAKKGFLTKFLRICIETLSSLPSIVVGLFGYLVFLVFFGLGKSLLAGALSVSILAIPVITTTTEDAINGLPGHYLQASLGLGATRFQTLYKVIPPSAIPGILSGVILSMGRVIGESAALFLTAGTVYKIPTSIMSSGRTLTVHAFLETKEKGDIASAAAAGIVLIVMIFILNLLAKFVSKKFNKANY